MLFLLNELINVRRTPSAVEENKPFNYTDPDGRTSTQALTLVQKIDKAVSDNIGYTGTDSMACDKFVSKVLTDANAKPSD